MTAERRQENIGRKEGFVKLFCLCSVTCCLFISGCATTEYRPLPEAPSPVITPKPDIKKPQGVYHKVQKGQTLWRIAKSYNVSVEELISANNIPNAAAIEVGQLLLIPGAKETTDISSINHTQDINKDEFAWPIKGKVISYYNDHRGEGANRGIDIEAGEGESVKASREGRVVLSDYVSGYNQTVIIDHGDGFSSVYAQNRKLLVKLGDHVFKGDPIAESGTVAQTGLVHFEIRKGKDSTNPLYYLP